MGGSIVLKLLANQNVKIKNAFIDGGITPYKEPWIFTRWIALKDFSLMWMGKLGHAGMALFRPEEMAKRIRKLD